MTINITVSGGKVSTPQALVDVPLGSPVELVVTSDVADHVHVHGYDEMVDVEPGTPARVGFNASIPGVFEVELESAKLRLVQLRVQ
jgi:heme/copper-type cytochrome/quinol oxidase subunit 2